MRAKFINEIVKGNKSGVEALGLGRTSLLKEFDHIKKEFPCIIEKGEALSNISILPDKIKNFVVTHFGCVESHILSVCDKDLTNDNSECVDMFLDFISEITDYTSIPPLQKEILIDNIRYVIHNFDDLRWDILKIRSYNENGGKSYYNNDRSFLLFRK